MRLWLKSIIFVLAAQSINAHANPQKTLDYIDVFNLEYAAKPIFHPDGMQLVYERRSMDIQTDSMRTQLWMLDLKSSQHRPLLADTHNYFSPVFSPSGDRLAYLSNKDGKSEIYVRWLDSAQTVKVTQLESSPSNLTWSPDGKHLAFSAFVENKGESLFKDMPAKPEQAEWAGAAKLIDKTLYRSDGGGFNKLGNTHLFLVDAIGGSARQLTSGEFNHGSQLSFSADGKFVYFDADRHPDWELRPYENDIFRVNINTGEIEQVTSKSGPEASPLISPDGEKLAYLWVNDRKLSFQVNQLMVAEIGTPNQSSSLTPNLDRNIQQVVWADDSNSIYIRYLDRGETKLAEVSLKGKMKTLDIRLGGQAIGRPYTSGEFAVNGKGNIVYTHDDPLRPADLWLFDGKKTRQLTSLNEDVFGHKTLANTQAISVTSSVDGLDIPAWIALPPNFDKSKRYPLILEIHGGPHAAYGNTFSMEVQLMAAKGYVVLWTNPRGSSSYGEDFANLIHHNYPSNDYHDLMDAVDAVVAKGYIDEKNLFITGGSGGGVLTAWSIGKTERFAAAVVAKPVINWMSFALTADAYPFFTQYWMPDVPWNIAEHLWQHSPLSLVGNVSTPTMLLTGEADYRTPMSETEQYYQALRLRQVDSAMVRIPGASHGIARRPSHLIQKVGNIVAWFDKYKQ